ncbi:MAG: DegV family EDD domain-containing protein [Pseudonocardiaceae bacterium]|nr:DegV family EDD domain-containing protein [Pseudonocardiaceae bacterium]
MPVAVVTDSTAYLPDGLAARRGIRVIPIHVTIDGIASLDGVDLGATDLVAALGRRAAVRTAGPTPGELAAAYTAALDAGADAVVSVHLSRALSGTWEAARLAAEQVGTDQIRVVDSRSTAMGLGFAVLAASCVAADGGDAGAVYGAAEGVAARTRTFFSVDTLEHLRRGGRISSATALLGTALAVKPLLHVADGRIVPLEKVRTATRARARLVELAAEAAGSEPVDIAVHHLGAADRAAELVDRLHDRLPALGECLVSEVGAAIGAHCGPGTLGAVVLPGGLASRAMP